jgi:hypothetical protein
VRKEPKCTISLDIMTLLVCKRELAAVAKNLLYVRGTLQTKNHLTLIFLTHNLLHLYPQNECDYISSKEYIYVIYCYQEQKLTNL